MNDVTTQVPPLPHPSNQQSSDSGKLNSSHPTFELSNNQAFSQMPQGHREGFAQFAHSKGQQPPVVSNGNAPAATALLTATQHQTTISPRSSIGALASQGLENPSNLVGTENPSISNVPSQVAMGSQFQPSPLQMAGDPFASLSNDPQSVDPKPISMSNVGNDVQLRPNEGEFQPSTSRSHTPDKLSVPSGGGVKGIDSVSKYKQGQKVYYKSKSYCGDAEILKVHLDDHLQPFYTINVQGKEKQTDDGHLCDESPVLAEIKSLMVNLTDEQLALVKDFVGKLLRGSNDSKNLTLPSPASATMNSNQVSFQSVGLQPSSTIVSGNLTTAAPTTFHGSNNIASQSQSVSESNQIQMIAGSPGNTPAAIGKMPTQPNQATLSNSQENSSFTGIPSPMSTMKSALTPGQMNGADFAPLRNPNDSLQQNINQLSQQFHQNISSNLSHEGNPSHQTQTPTPLQQHQIQYNPNHQMQKNQAHVAGQPSQPNPFDLF